MKTQVLKMTYGGIWTVVFDDEKKINPYTIYRTTYENGNKHRNKIEEYGNFHSCLCFMKDKVHPCFMHRSDRLV